MADPRVSANVAAAFGSMQARAVGVTDARPTTIDGATLVAALRDHLATVDPNLAAAIPDTAIPDLHLPDVDPPFVSSLRSVAEACTAWLAAIANPRFFLHEEWAVAISGDPLATAILKCWRTGPHYSRIAVIALKDAPVIEIYRRD